MSNDHDDRLFADETPSAAASSLPPWKVLVVDDEDDVHAVTRLVLSGFRYASRPLELLHARSAAEAEGLLDLHLDLAVVLLDVVMECDDAGLRLVRYIRETLQNRAVRIILRTGHPGQAPERQVMESYEINDYREKTELTTTRIYASLTSSLRSFQQICELDRQRSGLDLVLRLAAGLLGERSARVMADRMLAAFSDLCDFCGIPAESPRSGLVVVVSEDGRFTVLAGTGAHAGLRSGRDADAALPPEVRDHLRANRALPATFFGPDRFSGAIAGEDQHRLVFTLEGGVPDDDDGRRLLRTLFSCLAGAGSNIHLVQDLRLEVGAQRGTEAVRRVSTGRLAGDRLLIPELSERRRGVSFRPRRRDRDPGRTQ